MLCCVQQCGVQGTGVGWQLAGQKRTLLPFDLKYGCKACFRSAIQTRMSVLKMGQFATQQHTPWPCDMPGKSWPPARIRWRPLRGGHLTAAAAWCSSAARQMVEFVEQIMVDCVSGECVCCVEGAPCGLSRHFNSQGCMSCEVVTAVVGEASAGQILMRDQ